LCYIKAMKILALAAFLASVCCIVIPVNGQTPRKNTNTHQRRADDAKRPNIDAVDVGTVNVTNLNIPEQQKPQGESGNNGKESKPYFHRLIAAESLPNDILCIVGIAGVIAAFKTLIAVKEQAGLMRGQLEEMKGSGIQMSKQVDILEKSVAAAEKSADAAKDTVELLINKERAWLKVDVEDFGLPKGTENKPWYPWVNYKVFHFGPSNAILTDSVVKAILTESAEVPDDSERIWGMPIHETSISKQTIRPGQEPLDGAVPIEVPPRFVATPSEQDIEDLKRGTKFLHFWGLLKYSDVFGKTRITKFRFVWHNRESWGEWEKCGLEDNSET
jgi:hypothetical protein